jgi:hypothetical protein
VAEKELWIVFDPQENVTRREIVFVSAFSSFFCKFVLHFDWSTTCCNAFLCFAGFMKKRFSLHVKRLFKKPKLSCPDLASFVLCFELRVWWSSSQVFCFVYLWDLERIITQFHNTFPSSVMKIYHNASTDKALAYILHFPVSSCLLDSIEIIRVIQCKQSSSWSKLHTCFIIASTALSIRCLKVSVLLHFVIYLLNFLWWLNCTRIHKFMIWHLRLSDVTTISIGPTQII